VRIDPGMRWHHESGILRSAGWINLPSGEITTSPADVEGVLVPDGGVWSVADGDLPRATRLKFVVRAGRLVDVEGRDDDTRKQILAILDRDGNGRRVGQFGFGTNLAVLTPVGSLLQDQKMPGVHLGFGEPYGALTGAKWKSTVEMPTVVRRPDVTVDGQPVMVRGKYVPDLLG
jgi:leucyl aminopeptidase (aminopeptidase T)